MYIQGRFDGERLVVPDEMFSSGLIVHIGNSTFSTSGVTVRLPKVFSPLLIDEKTKERAERYCRNLLAQRFVSSLFIRDCLILAAKEGLQKAEERLEKIVQERPVKGQVKVYRHILSSGSASSNEVDVTDGEKAFTIYLPPQLTEKYPVNPYLYTESIYIGLNEEEWKMAEQELPELFNLLQVFSNIGPYVRSDTLEKIKKAFFRNREHAKRLVEKFSKLARQRRERDEIYRTIQTRPVKVSDGFLVSIRNAEVPWEERGLYYVNTKGIIHRVQDRSTHSIKQYLYRIVKKGVETATVTVCQPRRETRMAIASTLKEVAPELAVVILP